MVVLFLLAVLAFARETPFGRFIHRAAVETPADALSKLSVGHLLVALVLLGLVGAFIRYGLTDWLHTVVMGLPDFALWAMSFEVGVYLDAMAILAAISIVARFRLIRTVVAAYVASLPPRRWAVRLRERHSRRRTQPVSEKSGEDDISFAFAV